MIRKRERVHGWTVDPDTFNENADDTDRVDFDGKIATFGGSSGVTTIRRPKEVAQFS